MARKRIESKHIRKNNGSSIALNKCIVKLLDFLLIVWAHFPIMAMTDDNYYFGGCYKGNHKYRFNFVNIVLGEYRFQILSIPVKQKKEKVIILRCDRLSNLKQFIMDEEYSKKLEENYKNHCITLQENELIVEREALQRHLSYNQLRIDSSNAKINVYASIIVVVLPLLIAHFDWTKEFERFNILKWIVFIILCYVILNLCLFIFQTIRVRGFFVSRFSDLKESSNKAVEANWQLYYDWQQRKRNADMFVSFASFTQRWVAVFFVLSIVFFLVLH